MHLIPRDAAEWAARTGTPLADVRMQWGLERTAPVPIGDPIAVLRVPAARAALAVADLLNSGESLGPILAEPGGWTFVLPSGVPWSPLPHADYLTAADHRTLHLPPPHVTAASAPHRWIVPPPGHETPVAALRRALVRLLSPRDGAAVRKAEAS